MTAKQDLIAASLTLADMDERVAEMPTQAAADVREMCARAMVQPVGEVPMPEADMRGPIGTGVYFNGYTPNALRTYGDAREAAGYARGVAAEAKAAAPQPVGEVPIPGPMAYLYTLEYGSRIADTKVSVQQLNYPFGVCGADYLWRNEDGISYVRQTPLYTAALRVEVK